MNILITNDDGIYSPGIIALSQIACRIGSVRVVAPDIEQSSMGQAITHSRPLSYRKSPISFENVEAYRVNGTPSDCVALGTHIYRKTDVVLSGINMGLNLGNSAWHSGTLAAAREAVLLGIKGIALSTSVGTAEPDFKLLTPFVEEVIRLLINDPDFGLYNVNFPPNPKGILWTKQSIRFYDGKVVPGMDPLNHKHYWITVAPLRPAEVGSDRWAVENGYISITPLQLDLTDVAKLEQEKKKHAQNKPLE